MNRSLSGFSMGALLTLAIGALLPASAQADAIAPGKVFKDCKDCPQMVVLPAGTFTMGTPEDEVGHEPDESPQHPVTFAHPVAISRFQVLAGEWQAYLRDTGYVMPDGDDRPGRECKAGIPRYEYTARHPAVCMDLEEARAYVVWLSKKSGKIITWSANPCANTPPAPAAPGRSPSRSMKARNTASPSTPTPTAPQTATTLPRPPDASGQRLRRV